MVKSILMVCFGSLGVMYSRRSLSRTSRDPIKKFELSVVRDSQSVTSHVLVVGHCLPLCAIMSLVGRL